MAYSNNDLQLLFNEFVKSEIIPQHKCKQHLRTIEETHSVNSLHNIVIVNVNVKYAVKFLNITIRMDWINNSIFISLYVF